MPSSLLFYTTQVAKLPRNTVELNGDFLPRWRLMARSPYRSFAYQRTWKKRYLFNPFMCVENYTTRYLATLRES